MLISVKKELHSPKKRKRRRRRRQRRSLLTPYRACSSHCLPKKSWKGTPGKSRSKSAKCEKLKKGRDSYKRKRKDSTSKKWPSSRKCKKSLTARNKKRERLKKD